MSIGTEKQLNRLVTAKDLLPPEIKQQTRLLSTILISLFKTRKLSDCSYFEQEQDKLLFCYNLTA